MSDALQFVLGIALSIFGFFFLYVQSVCVHEQKTGKRVKMFWEED